MHKTEIIGGNETGNIVYAFLNENFGEKPTQIKTYMFGNILTIFAADCFHPGELNYINIGENWRIVHDIKTKEFDTVKAIWKSIVEEKTGLNIKSIYSIIEKNGFRFILIVFMEDLNNRIQLKESV